RPPAMSRALPLPLPTSARAAHRTMEPGMSDCRTVAFHARLGDDRNRHLLPYHEADRKEVWAHREPASIPGQRCNFDCNRGSRARALYYGSARTRQPHRLREALQSGRLARSVPTFAAACTRAATGIQGYGRTAPGNTGARPKDL